MTNAPAWRLQTVYGALHLVPSTKKANVFRRMSTDISEAESPIRAIGSTNVCFLWAPRKFSTTDFTDHTDEERAPRGLIRVIREIRG
jgi:hypothetical protein